MAVRRTFPGAQFLLVNSTTAVYPSDGLGGATATLAGSAVDGAKLIVIERILTDNRTSVDDAVVIESPGGDFTTQAYYALTASGHKSTREPFIRVNGPFTARVAAVTGYALVTYRVLA